MIFFFCHRGLTHSWNRPTVLGPLVPSQGESLQAWGGVWKRGGGGGSAKTAPLPPLSIWVRGPGRNRFENETDATFYVLRRKIQGLVVCMYTLQTAQFLPSLDHCTLLRLRENWDHLIQMSVPAMPWSSAPASRIPGCSSRPCTWGQ